MFTTHLLFFMLAPLLVSSFYTGVSLTRHQPSVRSETSLQAKITPNQGESMDMYRKVSYTNKLHFCPRFLTNISYAYQSNESLAIIFTCVSVRRIIGNHSNEVIVIFDTVAGTNFPTHFWSLAPYGHLWYTISKCYIYNLPLFLLHVLSGCIKCLERGIYRQIWY